MELQAQPPGTRRLRVNLEDLVDAFDDGSWEVTAHLDLESGEVIRVTAETRRVLAAFFGQHRPELVGNDYLVVGTEDRADWLRGTRTPLSIPEALECLHDFADVVRFEPAPRWGPA